MTPRPIYRIIEEDQNFVIFENILGNPILYERIMGTVHDMSNGDNGLVARLRDAERDVTFVADIEYVLQDLAAGDWEDLILEVTENCNARCGYCLFSGIYVGERIHAEPFEPKDMELEIALKAVNYYAPHAKGVGHVGFFGGEPFLNLALIQAVIDVCRDGLLPDATFNFTTNAILVYKYAEWLVENDIYLAISLDGPQHIHDRFRVTRRGQGTFNSVHRAVDRLRDISPEYANRIVFTTTLSHPALIDQVREYFAVHFPDNELIASGVEGRYIITELPTHRPEDIHIMRSKLGHMADEYVRLRRGGAEYDDLDPFLRGFFHRLEWMARQRTVGPLADSGKLPLIGACTPGKRKLYITVDGSMYPCERIGGHMQIGHVDTGLDMSMIGARLQQYAEYRNNVCSDCWAVRACEHCYTASKGGDTDGTGLSLESTQLHCPGAKDTTLIGLSLMTAIEIGG